MGCVHYHNMWPEVQVFGQSNCPQIALKGIAAQYTILFPYSDCGARRQSWTPIQKPYMVLRYALRKIGAVAVSFEKLEYLMTLWM